MKLSRPSVRRGALAPALVALAFVAAACGSDDDPTPPTTPPPSDASTTPDRSTTPDAQPPPPPPVMDAGGITCGMNTCTSRIISGQLGLPCCARQGVACGLNFGQGCIDQSDGGFTPPPMDAGPVAPDPSCGELPITVMGMMLTLSGCCLADGMCGYYSPQNSGFGCASLAQLRGFGIPVPDASMACGEGGTTPPDGGMPDTGNPPDAGNPPDTGSPGDSGTGQDSPADNATPDGIAPDSSNPGDGAPRPDGSSDGATPPDGGSSDAATG